MALRGATMPDQAPKGASPGAQLSLRRFPDAASQAAAVAEELAAALRQAIAERGTASLVLSGGRTPELMLAVLAMRPLPWPQLQIWFLRLIRWLARRAG